MALCSRTSVSSVKADVLANWKAGFPPTKNGTESFGDGAFRHCVGRAASLGPELLHFFEESHQLLPTGRYVFFGFLSIEGLSHLAAGAANLLHDLAVRPAFLTK
jgi:uncharacterized membrane protein